MTARRRALALAAALLPGAGGVLAIVLLAACSGAATTLCGSQSVAVSGGAYTVMNNEWHSGAPQCITTGGDASFTVTSSSIAVRHGTPGGYPFIDKGCHWGACTPGRPGRWAGAGHPADPLGRLGTPSDIAGAAAPLASLDARWLTRQINKATRGLA